MSVYEDAYPIFPDINAVSQQAHRKSILTLNDEMYAVLSSRIVQKKSAEQISFLYFDLKT